ncbi:MAG: tetratricopeptide repeat protein [Sphingobacteriaceae bacterium]|nr:tetratricopeptide repeat protein [Sphingobacteriaceae bacterium]
MLRFLIVFLFCGFKHSSQDADTLLTTILNIENDTTRVNQLYKQGFDLVDKNPQLAYTYAQNCERAAKKSKSLKHISKSKNLLGRLFYTHGHYKRAVICFEEYLRGSEAINDTLGMAYGYMNLANAYMQLDYFERVEYFYLKAIYYYNILNNKEEVANGLTNLAVHKHLQKQLDAALENYLKAYEIGKELNNYNIKANCLNNMAQVFLDNGNYEKALAYNYDALELRELMELDVDVCDSRLSIVEVALKQKNPSLAEENLAIALEICNKIGYTQGKINYHKLFSELQEQKNNHQASLENYKLYKQLNDSILLTEGDEIKFDFTEVAEPAYTPVENGTKNMWLLSLLSLILVIIPFVLIRYKR